MNKKPLFDPNLTLQAMCFIVLTFLPLNMLISPIFDFSTVEQRRFSWTVTMTAYQFVQIAGVFFAVALIFLRSRPEKLFLICLTVFLLYAFSFTIYVANSLFYPLFGLISVLGSALVGVLFYVSTRDELVSPEMVVKVIAFAALFVAVPLLLVHIDTGRYSALAHEFGGSNILYGYENPRALGWASTICLTVLVAYCSTQPPDSKIKPMLIVLTMIAATTLFWSGSRGGVVAFAASTVFVLIFSRTKNYKGALLTMSSVAAGASISYFLFLPNKSFGIFSRISHNLQQDNIASMGSGRVELWQLTISYILERPLTGYGFLPHKDLAGFTHGSAHNLVLDSWLWFGLVIGTVVLLLSFMAWAIAFAFFRKANDASISALFCIITALLAYCMISGPYARTFPLLFFAIATGVIFGHRAALSKSMKLSGSAEETGANQVTRATT